MEIEMEQSVLELLQRLYRQGCNVHLSTYGVEIDLGGLPSEDLAAIYEVFGERNTGLSLHNWPLGGA